MRHLSSLASSSAFATAVALFSAVSLFSSGAAAHIELVEPAPRYELPANKSCPCGDGDSNRQCDVPAAESHDPNRSANVQTFTAGSTITVVADEYIDHAGRMRVAFDPDGADLADFNDNILMDVADPSESGLSMANPHTWTFQVQLPNTPCDNCTLQVIQVMNNNTTTPVMDPASFSTYYTCADIRIVAAGSEGDPPAGSSGSGGSANAAQAGGPSASGSGGAASTAGRGGASATGGSATAAGAGGGAALEADDEEEDDGGCALRPGTVGSSSLGALLLLGLAAARRRRR